MKRVPAIILAAALAVLLASNALAAQSGLSNFTLSDNYASGRFHDVTGREWYASYIEDAYNYGFIQGKSENTFDPGGLLTLGESVVLAVRLMSIYKTGAADFEVSQPFYEVYADYALSNGVIDSHGDYESAATRARFAQLVYNALPREEFSEINAVPDYAICDVSPASSYGDAVYALYRAGVLSGSDRFGAFFPESNITRAEACAVMVRLADPDSRVSVSLPARIPADLIFERNVNAAFLIETFDSDGDSIRTGSGFFFSGAGYAITNLHVFDNAARATVTTYYGDIYPVLGVNAVSEENNLAIFSVGSDYGRRNYLSLADSDVIETGNTVYALGSPLGLINTFTEGIVSNTKRELDGQMFIQFSAPISFGSGGSALLNALGQVIGVTSSSFSYGQNLNLAVPVNFIKELEPGELVPLADLLDDSLEDSLED